jgi:hypothetical protein
MNFIILSEKRKKLYFYFTFFLLLCLTYYPLALFQYPPLIDYYNHLASYYIQANIENNPYLQRNYKIEWLLNPYIIIQYLGGYLTNWMDIYIVGRVMIAIGFSTILIGSLMLRKELYGHIDFWFFVVFIFIYNQILFWGFINYYIASGFVLIAFSLWLKYRNHTPVSVCLSFSLISLILYFSHLFAFCVYGLLILGIELSFIYQKPRNYDKYNLIKFIIPFIFPFIFSIIWFLNKGNSQFGLEYEYGIIKHKNAALFSPIIFSVSDYQKYFSVLLIPLYFFLKPHFIAGNIKIIKIMILPLILLLIAAILMPFKLIGMTYLDFRIPYILAIILVVSINFNDKLINKKSWLLLSALIFFIFKSVWIFHYWNIMNERFKEFKQSLSSLTLGSKVLTVWNTTTPIIEIKTLPTHHMVGLAVIERSVFWPDLFTIKDLSPVRASPETEFIDSPIATILDYDMLTNKYIPFGLMFEKYQRVFWTNWEKDFDYLVSFHFEDNIKYNSNSLTLIKDGSFFDIYKIRH